MNKEYIIKLGEISLKGLNRKDFERHLAVNIKGKLDGFQSSVHSRKGRMHLAVADDVADDVVKTALSTTFGITSFARCFSCPKDILQIEKTAEQALSWDGFADDGASFKVDARREDKTFALTSSQLEIRLADVVHKRFPSLKVNLKRPDRTLHVEIRDKAYVYSGQIPSVSGLPVGSSGKAMALLSGGIDSPVATYMAASRGLRLELVYFHAYPYTSDEALEKVEALAGILSPFLGGTILHVVNFTSVQKLIERSVSVRERTLMLRAAMVRTAEMLARERRCGALVTGESLAQVASQTLEAMDFTDSMSNMLILRPLAGMDKEAITSFSKRIGTYQTSILPFSDCCSLFAPPHPITRPNREKERSAYFSMEGVEAAEKDAASSASVRLYPASMAKESAAEA